MEINYSFIKAIRKLFQIISQTIILVKFYNFGRQKKMIFIYNHLQRKIFQFTVDENKKMIILRKTIEDIDLNDYFVQRFNGKMYLIYSDKIKNCLTFKVLD